MKTITLKTDNLFFDKLNALAEHLHLSKSELIRRSVAEYELLIRRKEMKEQMKNASLRTRTAGSQLVEEFDDTLADGLDNV